MKAILLATIIIMLLAGPAAAQGFYHDFTLELDGEWDLDQSVEMPNQNSAITLKGVGKAKLKSVLREAPVWWDLF